MTNSMVWWVKGEVHDFYKTPWFGGLKGKFMIFYKTPWFGGLKGKFMIFTKLHGLVG